MHLLLPPSLIFHTVALPNVSLFLSPSLPSSLSSIRTAEFSWVDVPISLLLPPPRSYLPYAFDFISTNFFFFFNALSTSVFLSVSLLTVFRSLTQDLLLGFFFFAKRSVCEGSFLDFIYSPSLCYVLTKLACSLELWKFSWLYDFVFWNNASIF